MSSEPTVDLEHRALDRALADVEFLAQKRTFGPAARRFVEFRRSLERHLFDEEHITFPAFDRRTHDPAHVLPIVLAQHRELDAALDRLDAALSVSDYTAFCAQLDALDRLLKEHEATEERLLGPAP